MLNDLITVKDKVEYVLSRYPELRDSDRKLLLAVWSLEGFKLTEEQRRIFYTKCSSSESIRRIRQKLQEKGAYKASDNIIEQRFSEEVKMRNYFLKDKYEE